MGNTAVGMYDPWVKRHVSVYGNVADIGVTKGHKSTWSYVHDEGRKALPVACLLATAGTFVAALSPVGPRSPRCTR